MRLADLLAQVHKELREAERPPEPGSFVLESCDISLGVEVTTGGSGELEFSILGTGGKVGGEAKRAASHNLTFRFRPFRDGFEDPATKDDGPVPGLDPTLFPGIDVGQIMKKSPRGLPKTYLTGKKKPPV